MQRFILSLVLGLFVRPASPAIQEEATVPAPTPEVYNRAPAAAAQVEAARSAVKWEKVPQGEGVVLHRFTFPDGAVVEFPDRPKRPRDQAHRDRIVFYTGTQKAAEEPDSTFDAAGKASGLTPTAIEALRFISRHEGGFDAINTWDRARFSWGFIQFAGGYGLRPVLAHFKAASPELFQSLLADYGVDVLPGNDGSAEPLLVQPTGQVLRGNDAEQAYGDMPLIIALFIRAGRVPEVKQRQVEAAIRDYAAPALRATSVYTGTPLTRIMRSAKGLAMLIDRQVQEGNVARLQWAVEHVRVVHNLPDATACASLEAEILNAAVEDADARAQIAQLAETAAAALGRAATGSDTSLIAAREAMLKALDTANVRMMVSYRRGDMLTGISAALTATDPALLTGMAPQATAGQLGTVAGQLRDLVSRFRFESVIRGRLQNIRESALSGPGTQAAIH